MARRSNRKTTVRRRKKPHSRPGRTRPRRAADLGRRGLQLLGLAPPGIRILAGVVAIVAIWSAANWAYQIVHKPTELYFPVSSVLAKTPPETWKSYGPIFRRHSTDVITPEFLAALAQVEASGNPVARTYWRWSLTSHPFELYRPASSAVGMYQITDATFDIAKRYCIHDHAVVEDGPWHAWRSCWFNGLYTRVVPSHAVELTAALLDRQVAAVIRRQRVVGATPEQRQDLAAVIHLCGFAAGNAYARSGFRLTPGRRCGDHDVRAYLARMREMKRTFARLTE